MNEYIEGNRALRIAIRAALTGGTLAASFGAVQAQEAPTPTPVSGPEAGLAEVVVTGSRIAVPNQTSIAPVTFVTAADIQATGVTRVEDVLNQLPQVFADQGSMVSNGSTGTATINLRGLNAKRTLVLVNGFRLGPGDPTNANPPGASDINIIPTELIENVEVLTGGASSTYGADAVAGVVNFKLNDHFEGVKLVAGGGINSHNNRDTAGVEEAETTKGDALAPSHVNTGAEKDLAFIAGLNSADGNGNATFYATYRNNNAAQQNKFSTSACTLGSGYVAGSSSTGGKFYCSGSSTSYPGRFIDSATGSSDTVTANGTLVHYSSAANSYNYGALNYYERPDQRYTTGAFLHYAFNENADVYSQTMYMNDRTVAQIAPSGAFISNTYTVNCANPFLSASELTSWCGGSTAGNVNLLIGRRNVEGGDRQDDLEHSDFREVLGVKGKITNGWDYDASFQYGIVNYAETYYNDVSSTKVNYALDVITNPATGQPECAVTATSPSTGLGVGCVPWNIFSAGSASQAAANYINAVGQTRGRVSQTVVNTNVSGDLGQYGVQLPTANSGLKVNFGAEYRDVTSFVSYDEEYLTGDLAGQGGAKTNVNGGIVSREGFVEARMPLMEDKPGAKSLNFETGYRYSEYSTGFTTNTFKVGLDWAPIQDIRLRANFSRASRAPNIIELYSTTSVGLDGNTDPCSGTTPTYSAAQCARTGVSAAQYGHILTNPSAQYNGLQGGNTGLVPETAITKSFGIGFTPSFLPNFRAQFDYYDINIENVIQTVGADTILKQCAQNGLFCNDIHRDSTGSLWTSTSGYVVDSLANVGNLDERGVDADISYAFDLGAAGKLRANLVGTYVDKYQVTPVAATTSTSYNCAGYYGTICSSVTAGAGTPVYRWRNTLHTTWSTPWDGLDLTLSWRYYGGVKNEQLSPNSNLAAANGGTVANGGVSSTDAKIASYSYFDLSGSIRLSEKVSLRLGVNNLLDKDPPVIGATNLPSTSGNGNTFPQVYDSLGRYIFGQVTAQF